MSSVTTPKGTELPILDLKGKNYLEVKWRLVWFREEKPEWSIETDFPVLSDSSAVAKAVIKNEAGRIIATGHKREDKAHFPDFSEKAESGAIGRALALIGYGTQFAAELEEGERIVDSPVPPKGKAPVNKITLLANLPAGDKPAEANEPAFNLEDFQVTFGKKYLGKRLKEIPRKDMQSYIDWLEKKAKEKNVDPGPEVDALKSAAAKYYVEPKDYVVPMGRFEGMTLKNMDIQHVKDDYAYWTSQKFKSNPVSRHITALEAYLNEVGEIDMPLSSQEIPF